MSGHFNRDGLGAPPNHLNNGQFYDPNSISMHHPSTYNQSTLFYPMEFNQQANNSNYNAAQLTPMPELAGELFCGPYCQQNQSAAALTHLPVNSGPVLAGNYGAPSTSTPDYYEYIYFTNANVQRPMTFPNNGPIPHTPDGSNFSRAIGYVPEGVLSDQASSSHGYIEQATSNRQIFSPNPGYLASGQIPWSNNSDGFISAQTQSSLQNSEQQVTNADTSTDNVNPNQIGGLLGNNDVNNDQLYSVLLSGKITLREVSSFMRKQSNGRRKRGNSYQDRSTSNVVAAASSRQGGANQIMASCSRIVTNESRDQVANEGIPGCPLVGPEKRNIPESLAAYPSKRQKKGSSRECPDASLSGKASSRRVGDESTQLPPPSSHNQSSSNTVDKLFPNINDQDMGEFGGNREDKACPDIIAIDDMKDDEDEQTSKSVVPEVRKAICEIFHLVISWEVSKSFKTAIPVDSPEDFLEFNDCYDITKLRRMDLATIGKKLDHYNCLWDFFYDLDQVINCARFIDKATSDGKQGYAIKINEFEEILKKVRQLVAAKFKLCCSQVRYMHEPIKRCCQAEKVCPVAVGVEHWEAVINNNETISACQPCFDRNFERELNISKSKFKLVAFDHNSYGEQLVRCQTCERRFHSICIGYVSPDEDGLKMCHVCKDLPMPNYLEAFESLCPRKLPSNNKSRAMEKDVLDLDEKLDGKIVIRPLDIRDASFEYGEKYFAHFLQPRGIEPTSNYQSQLYGLFYKHDIGWILDFSFYAEVHGPETKTPCVRNCVNIAYVEGAKHMPGEFRTKVYKETLLSFMKLMAQQGIIRFHMWVCPPKGSDDYIFNVRPSTSRDRTAEEKFGDLYEGFWDPLLKAAIEREIVSSVTYGVDWFEGRTPKSFDLFPLFAGDSSLRQQLENEARKLSDHSALDDKERAFWITAKQILSAEDSRTFVVAHLKNDTTISGPSEATDNYYNSGDETFKCAFMSDRCRFLTACRLYGYEFGTPRMAAYSTALIIKELQNPQFNPEDMLKI